MKPPRPGNPFCVGSRLNKGINHKGHEVTQRFSCAGFLCAPSCPLWLKVSLYFFSLMSTEACVFSQLMLSAQLPPIGVRAIVKFSTGDAVGETFMSTRPSSSLSYLYGMPHSPVFLLMI